MRTPRYLCLAVALAVAVTTAAPAFAAGDTDVSGRIQSANTHLPVNGARVEIRELHRSLVTGPDGRYRFDDLAPGSYTLVVSLAGRNVGEESFIANGGDRPLDVEVVTEHAKELESVQVTGQQTGAVAARAQQEQAPNLILVQSASEIQKLPDVNAGEAVRRLPGISLETDTGEGRFVNIRGLDADLNSTTFDGVRLPPTNTASPQGGGRAVAFDAIPAGMVGTITITNTNLPEQDAEALGGTIDIRPKQIPKGRDSFVEGELGYGNENLRDTPVKDVQLTGGVRFGFGDSAYKPFSFVGTVSYYQDRRGIDDIEAAYVDDQADGVPDKAFAEFDQRYYNYDRRRHGYGGQLDFQPDADDRWFVTYFDTGYTELKSDQHLDISLFSDPTLFSVDPSNPNGFIDQGASFDKKAVDHAETIDSRIAIFGGENVFPTFKLDYHAALTIGSYNSPYNYSSDFATPGGALGTVQYDNTTDPNRPSIAFTGGIDPLNPANYTLSSLTNDTAHDHEQERSGAIDATIPVGWFGDDRGVMKFGIDARVRNRNEEVGSFSYDVPPLLLSQADTGQPITYYAGAYHNGFNIDPSVIRALIASLPVTAITNDEDAGFSLGEEDVYASYGQYEFHPTDKLGLIGGLRFERTEASYTFDQQTLDANGNVAANTFVTQDHDYNNVFPTLQARYEIAPQVIARAVYSKTIARPGFNQVSGAVTVDPGQGTISTGNPDLQPITSNNFDLDIEDYLGDAGIASIGVFHKALTNYIVGTQFTEIDPTTGPLAGYHGIVLVSGWENIHSAQATGMQLNYVQKFDDLPGWLAGLGVNANYTWIDSRLEVRPNDFTLLPSTSRDTANLALTWDHGSWTLDLAGYYESRNVFAIGGSDATDVWSQPRYSLDFGASYRINKVATAFFDAKNLTNTPLKFTEGPGANRPIQREYYDASLLAGLRVAF